MRSGGVRYCPRWLVTTAVDTPVATCVTTTGAPGIGAPLSSSTVPTTMALSACWATAGGDASARPNATRAARRTNEDQDDIDHAPKKKQPACRAVDATVEERRRTAAARSKGC